MNFLSTIAFLLIGVMSYAQTMTGSTTDSDGRRIPGVQVNNSSSGIRGQSDSAGDFSISVNLSDTILFIYTGFDTNQVIITPNLLDPDKPLIIIMKGLTHDVGEVTITQKRMAEFDVGYLPPIKGVQIYTGTNAVIELANLNGAKSTANPRELFAKVPGLNIWESDGSGIQMGIGGRGLSPNRTANFNTRQNGYDISADALGYPESYYTPPIEALSSIEIIRGSASLQFGTQFGGLLNFLIKSPPTNTAFELTTRNTIGSFGYFGTFNRIAGSTGRFSYQTYHQFKRGDGYRDNSDFKQHQFFGEIGYFFSDRIRARIEYTHMNYLAHQAGGLTDFYFEQNARQSFRDRNWFTVDWNVLALHFDHEISAKSHLNIRAFGMISDRKTLGFLGKITQADPGNEREMLEGLFRNAGAEARFLHRYTISRKETLNLRGAFLIGARCYRGKTMSNQGIATGGNDPDFSYRNPENLESSSFTYPSENIAGFVENILFIGKRLTVNFGGRLESIRSGSSGYYKRYIIHPVNNDTLDIQNVRDSNLVERTVPLFGFGSSYKFGKRSTMYTNFTQNYRAINFTDIRVNNPNIVIDSAIRDEYGYTTEVGFRGLKNDFLIYDLAVFYIFYGDKIGLAPKQGTTLKERTNIGDAQNYGLEIFSEFDFLRVIRDSSAHSLSVFVNGTYINARYIKSKEPNYIDKKVEYVSSIIIRSGMRYRFRGFSVQIQGSYNSEQFSDASNSVTPSGDAVIGLIPAYHVLDFSCRYAFKKNFQLEFGINNFTNQIYFTRRAAAYPGPGILPSDGINAYFTAQYTFSAERKIK